MVILRWSANLEMDFVREGIITEYKKS